MFLLLYRYSALLGSSMDFTLEKELLALLERGEAPPAADVIRWSMSVGAAPFSASRDISLLPIPPAAEQTASAFTPESFQTYQAFGAWVSADVMYQGRVWHVNIPCGAFTLLPGPADIQADELSQITMIQLERHLEQHHSIPAQLTYKTIEGVRYLKVRFFLESMCVPFYNTLPKSCFIACHT